MLESLELSGFRGFDALEVPGLAQVNLLVGMNNSGKTTILEAVELLLSGCAPETLVQGLERRGELEFTDQESPSERMRYEVSHLFSGHRLALGSIFTISGRREWAGRVEFSGEIVRSEPSHDRQLGFTALDEEARPGPGLSLRLTSNSPEPAAVLHVPLSSETSVSPRHVYMLQRTRENDIKPIIMISGESMSEPQMRSMWDDVVLTPAEEQILAAMRIIEPSIQRLAFRTGDGPRRTGVGGSILVKHAQFEERIPLGSLGDGVRRLMALAMAASQAAGGCLLVDEIDTGLHYSVMMKMWRMLIETARRLDIQVFATTHSLDCVRSLAWLYEDSPEVGEAVRLHRVERERPQTIVYKAEELPVAIREQIEVR